MRNPSKAGEVFEGEGELAELEVAGVLFPRARSPERFTSFSSQNSGKAARCGTGLCGAPGHDGLTLAFKGDAALPEGFGSGLGISGHRRCRGFLCTHVVAPDRTGCGAGMQRAGMGGSSACRRNLAGTLIVGLHRLTIMTR